MSDSLTSNKGEGYQGTRTKVPVEGQNVVLPKYNNQGEDFFYTVEEVNVPDDFESAVTNEDGTIIITNTKKKHQVRQSQVSQSKPPGNGAKYDRAKCHRSQSATEPSTTGKCPASVTEKHQSQVRWNQVRQSKTNDRTKYDRTKHN